MTINRTWSFKSNDTSFKTTVRLIRMLIDIASKGGNFLLNVGPEPEGVIPAGEVERISARGFHETCGGIPSGAVAKQIGSRVNEFLTCTFVPL
jgi:hypothetical protein